jgi:hypothetical protein
LFILIANDFHADAAKSNVSGNPPGIEEILPKARNIAESDPRLI